MSDPYCYECGQFTGGCWRHNGTGIYTADENGQLRKTHAPTVIVKDGTGIYTADENGQLRKTHAPAVVVKDGISVYYLEPTTVPFEVVNGVWK
jgi:hypothetical protein